MDAVDWSAYLACDACTARRGRPCWSRSSGGPQALPEVFADRPHSGRPLAADARPPAPSAPSVKQPPRRRAPAKRATPPPAKPAPPAWLKTRRRGGGQ